MVMGNKIVHYLSLLWIATVLSVLFVANQTRHSNRIVLGVISRDYLSHLSKLEENALDFGKGKER